jgi:16S rRNA (cytosine1402-N4)-methyltransferase
MSEDTQHNHEHISVLKSEALAALQVTPGNWYIDGTFGRGGHTSAILEQGGNVIAFDCDQDAIAYGEATFADHISAGKLILVNQNFDKLRETWFKLKAEKNIPEVTGILFDFGLSSPQLADGDRGFSFLSDGPLDMRMDKRLGVQAKDLLAILPEKQLAEMIWLYGGEEHSRKIAKMIVEHRKSVPFTSTQHLAASIARIRPRIGHLHPATKTFQALRIAVNSELDSIESALPQALEIVKSGGRIVTISFHEGEDRIAKHTLVGWEKQGKGQMLEKKAVSPTEEEITHNQRSRSAKLRAFIKQ